ncbi:type II and III secretion system protein family protein [Vibrio owensii]|uniref:type II and III secretion system protein family protein n=1 Tax=Vibrio owensii TaxID=696485 RepID=UPI0009B89989|nr:type II and III secretion system protein family protein [Vibrio owensii]
MYKLTKRKQKTTLFKKLGLFSAASLLSFNALANSVISLSEGDSRKVTVESDIGSVFVSDPTIGDYQVIDKNNVIVFGKKEGKTTVAVFDENGGTLRNHKLIVKKDLSEVVQGIKIHYPYSDVKLYNVGDQVVLTGTVESEGEKEAIYELVGTLLGKGRQVEDFEFGDASEEGGQTVKSLERVEFDGVVNNLEVNVTKQVNVKLSIAEVSKNFLEEVGFGYSTAGASNGVFVNNLMDFTADNILNVINAVGNDTIGQVLAEPNLSVVSGESASFLVGGELPLETTSDNGTNIEYKEFGVRLDMTAKVKRDDKITLTLMPEVSSLDSQYGDSDLPVIRTRRARTTIELADGQSFVLGGLLNSEDRESLQKLPFIGDIPVLGALFRNSTTERNQTELVIVATVNLVKPVQPGAIQLPSMKKTSTLSRFFNVEEGDKPETNTRFENEILATGGFKK